MSGSNALQIADPNADNPLAQAPSWADAAQSVAGTVSSGVDALGQWLAAQRAKSAQRGPVWPMSNPVGTETTQQLTMPTPGVQDVAFWGGQPVSQQFKDTAQSAIGNALGWVGSAGPGSAGLPMDLASRLQRAKDMGFDTSKTMYHATPYDFSEFVPSNWRGATYLAPTPEGAMRGAGAGGMEHPALSGPTGSGEETGMRIIPAYTAGKVWGRDPLPSDWLPPQITYGEYKAIVNGTDRIAPEGLSKQEIDAVNLERRDAARRHYTEAVPESEYHKYTGDNENQLPMKLESPPVARTFGYESYEGGDRPNAFAPSGSMAPADFRTMLQKLGYSGWMVKDEAGSSVAIADPSKIRSIFANFDPSKAGSRNITAGLAGLLAAGVGAGTYPQQ